MSLDLSTEGFVGSSSSGGGGGGGGTITISFTSPTPDTAPGASGGMPSDYPSAAMTPLVVQILDTDGSAAIVYAQVAVSFQGLSTEVAYRSGGFTAAYSGSSATEIANGIQLTLVRNIGWPGAASVLLDLAVTLTVDALDVGGTLTSALASYQMPVNPGPAQTIFPTSAQGSTDHVAAALGRLPMMFRS